ncbi:hypothetical protein GQ53DRAFT_522525 [Thozetella sp. PMI_491]|nr:hypothetical protein GQ53DRAFT_522525 [Thozetella sp. PMI_491]
MVEAGAPVLVGMQLVRAGRSLPCCRTTGGSLVATGNKLHKASMAFPIRSAWWGHEGSNAPDQSGSVNVGRITPVMGPARGGGSVVVVVFRASDGDAVEGWCARSSVRVSRHADRSCKYPACLPPSPAGRGKTAPGSLI